MSGKIHKEHIFRILFIGITLFLLIYRISLHADIYDEIINLTVSYRIALGDVPFYNCWEAYQGGDILMAIFIFLYVNIMGTTSGIIFYARGLYLICLFLLAIYTYFIFRKRIDKTIAFYLSYIICFFEIYGLFYLWYDTVSIIFLFLGCLLVIDSLFEESVVKKILKLILAGIVHCWMALSYPAFAVLAVAIGISLGAVEYAYFGKKVKNTLTSLVSYGIGAVIFLSCFLGYLQIRIGLDRCLETFHIISGSRGINSIGFLSMISAVCVSYLNVNQFLIIVSIIMFALFFKSLRQEKYIPIFLAGLFILPFFNLFFIEKRLYLGLADYLSYIMLGCPFVYSLLKNRNKFDTMMIMFFFIPSIFSVLLIPTTTVYGDVGPIKSWQACLPGAIATLYFASRVLMEMGKRFFLLNNILLCVVTVILLVNSYSYVYLNQPYIKSSDKRITDGIYCGIKVNENMLYVSQLRGVLSNYTEGKQTILAGSNLREIYLMSKLRPFVWSVEAPAYYKEDELCWDMAIEYFEYFNDLPDLICVEQWELMNEKIEKIIDKYYKQVFEGNIGSTYIYIFEKIGNIQNPMSVS